jgi:hypothetical protein
MRSINLGIEEHIPNLELDLRRLALEASVLENVVATFREVLPSLSSKIFEISKSFSNSETSSLIDAKEVKEANVSIKNAIKGIGKDLNTFNIDKLLISIPIGFKGNLIEYGEFLNSHIKEVVSLTNTTLSDFNFMLSSFITNKEDKFSNTDRTHFINKIKAEREKFSKKSDQFFNPNGIEKTYFHKVLNRISDIDRLIDITILVDKSHFNSNIKNITSSLRQCLELLDIASKGVEDQAARVSGASAKNISEGAYEIAKLVEYLSILRFRTEAYITSVIKLLMQLNHVFSK